MRVIAVDDEPLSLELIEIFSRRVPFIRYEHGFIKTGAALDYLERNDIDLLFLDIYMPAMNGIKFYRLLKHKPMLIITTSYSDQALEGYALDAIDSLFKPFGFDRFEEALTKAYRQYKSAQNGIL